MNLITPSEGFLTRYLVIIALLAIVWIAVGSIAGFGRNWNNEVISRTFWIAIPILILAIIGLVIKKIVGRPV